MLKQNYVKYFEDAIKKHWDLPAFSNVEDHPFYFKDVASRIIWLHKVLDKCGIKRGDKVALVGKNSAHWAISYLAITTYGAVVVPILPNFTPSDMTHIVNHSEAKMIFVGNSIFDNIEEENLPKLQIVIHLDTFTLVDTSKEIENTSSIKDSLKEYNDVSKDKFSLPKDISNKELGEIIYTSGTTGFTKGVMLPLNSLITNVVVADEMLSFRTGSNMLSFLPLSHAYACAFDFLYPFTRGVHIHFLGKIPSPKLLLKHLKAVKPEMIMSVPLILEKIIIKNVFPMFEKKLIRALSKLPGVKHVIYNKIKQQLLSVFGGSLEEMIIGGAPLNSEVEKFLKEIKFPFTIGYGMSECGPLISYTGWKNHKYRSAGQRVNYLQAKIDSPDGKNIPGNILVKGEQLMYGYYKNDEATAEVIDKDGWLNTGDIGLIDDEDFIFIKGRSKSLILGPSGENIYPEAIEQTFNTYSFIQESLLLQRDNKLVIHVFPDFDEADKKAISEKMFPKIMEQNKATYNQTAPAYAKISKITIVAEAFQKTPTQKIKRYLYK